MNYFINKVGNTEYWHSNPEDKARNLKMHTDTLLGSHSRVYHRSVHDFLKVAKGLFRMSRSCSSRKFVFELDLLFCKLLNTHPFMTRSKAMNFMRTASLMTYFFN